jgi:ribosome recycling factor
MVKMDKSFEAVQRSFTTVRTGRANPSMLDRIQARLESGT